MKHTALNDDIYYFVTRAIDTDIVCALGCDVNVVFTVGHGQSLKHAAL